MNTKQLWNKAKEKKNFVAAVKAIHSKYSNTLREAKEIVDKYSTIFSDRPRDIDWEKLEYDHFVFETFYLITTTQAVDNVATCVKVAMQLYQNNLLKDARDWLALDFDHLDLVQEDQTDENFWLAYEGQDFDSMVIHADINDFQEITKEEYDVCKKLKLA